MSGRLVVWSGVGLVVVCCAARCGPGAEDWRVVFEDRFGGAAHSWSALGGTWTAAHGVLRGRSSAPGQDAMAYRQLTPMLDVQRVTATVRPGERLEPAQWSLAGIVLLRDSGSFWMLALVEDKAGRRTVDFLEKCGGVWQAQNQGETKLAATEEKALTVPWEYGRSYDLELALDREGVSARVMDTQAGTLMTTRRYAFGTRRAVRTGVAGLILRDTAADYARVCVRAPASASGNAVGIDIVQGTRGSVAILDDALPGADSALAAQLSQALTHAGFGVTHITGEQAADSRVLRPETFRLFVVPNAVSYPIEAMPALTGYLSARGNLMVLGAPAFTRPVWLHNKRWLDNDMVRAELKRVTARRVWFDFDGATVDTSAWRRASNDMAATNRLRVVGTEEKKHGKCLEIHTGNLTGWDTYRAPPVAGMFGPDDTLLCFRARGDAATPQLAVELSEEDGSRWIATVPLTMSWDRHVLCPADFTFWPDSQASSRGATGDCVNPQRVVALTVGLARSHTDRVGDGPHTVWLDDIGTAPNPVAEPSKPRDDLPPVIETVSPSYKTYELGAGLALAVAAVQRPVFGGAGELPAVRDAFSCFARPQGKGIGHGCRWRWVPLVEATDANDERRGWPLWLMIDRSFPFNGAVIAACGVNDPAFYRNKAVLALLARTAERMARGVFLLEAGTDRFSYWPDDPARIGATLMNAGTEAAELTVDVTVRAPNGDVVHSKSDVVALAGGDTETVGSEWRPTELDPALDYEVRTELRAGDELIDVVSHNMGVLSARKPSADEFVTVRGADFIVNGRKWYPVGINFWALYVSGLEPGDYHKGWLHPAFYDPEEAELDLQRMAALGINMVSIQLGGAENVPNLLDFMRRCRRHDVRINGYLGGASPLGFDEAAVRAVVEGGRLAENPVLFAYDTIWEPGNWVFRKDKRGDWDGHWSAWLVARYGSVAAAERDWGVPVPRTATGAVTSPSDKQLREAGPWHVMVAAYRRFMDDFASRRWNDAHRRLRAIDPNHLVSFRQGNTLPQDFTFTATPKHIDFICPEGYAIKLGEDGYNAAGFITRYVDFTTRGKPILWSEFGKSIWDRAAMRPDARAEAMQTTYHDMFYRMVLESGATGTAPWWWPGGYRVNERSDFGVCNPDGTPRGAANLIRHYATALKAPRDRLVPTETLVIDRDRHPGGYWRLAFNEGRDAYAKAAARGGCLGLRTTGTGTTSANTPLVAVGNTPYNGSNPPKYLNAEFNWFRIRAADGQWVDVANGATVTVDGTGPVRARISIGNTQEATWLAPVSAGAHEGAVYLASCRESGLEIRQPIARDTPYLADADLGEFTLASRVTRKTRVTVQMTAHERAWFGEKLNFELAP